MAAVAAGGISNVEVEGRALGVLGVDVIKGELQPSVVDGRGPRDDDEILLGTKTMSDIDAELGDTVEVSSGNRRARMVVVGTGALPQINAIEEMTRGAAMTFRAVRGLRPDLPRNTMLVRVNDATSSDELARIIGEALVPLADQLGATEEELRELPVRDVSPPRPTDLVELGSVDRMPGVLAAGAGLVAVAMLVHLLVSSVRQRRRDLAVLKVLGFVRGQVSATVAWQATTLVVIAVVIGVPLGITAGQWLWSAYTEEVGVVFEVVTPAWSLVLASAGALVLANLAAAVPGWLAGRTRAAVVLRSE